LSLQKISDELISGIRKDWFEQLDDFDEESAYLGSSIERIIDWCEKVLSQGEPICLWSLCEDDSTKSRAILEITDARKSKDPSFKFLNIYLEPSLIFDCKEEVRQEELIEVINITSYALIASLQLALQNGTKKLKIFGRTEEMRSLFDSLVLTAKPEEMEATVYRQGKWLVIEKNG